MAPGAPASPPDPARPASGPAPADAPPLLEVPAVSRSAATAIGSPAPVGRQAPLEQPEVEDREAVGAVAAPPWLTILHNCDCHTFEQVVRQLMKAIGCTEARGWELAWEVHNTGKAVVKVGAETECVKAGNILAAIGLVVTVVQS